MNGNIQFMVSFNSYMFRHRSAIGRESLQASVPWTNTPFQILTTLTVMIRILKFGCWGVHYIAISQHSILHTLSGWDPFGSHWGRCLRMCSRLDGPAANLYLKKATTERSWCHSTVGLFVILNFCCVLNVVCFLLGNSPASEFYMPTSWNTLSVPSA